MVNCILSDWEGIEDFAKQIVFVASDDICVWVENGSEEFGEFVCRLTKCYAAFLSELATNDKENIQVDIVFGDMGVVKPTEIHFQHSSITHIALKEIETQKYDNVAVGGTFDHLHAGHKVLITAAARISHAKLLVGISGDPLLRNKQFKTCIEPFEKRKLNVERFLEKVKPALKVQIAMLNDPLGPTINDASLNALVVSQETIVGAQKSKNLFKKVNEERIKVGLTPLQVFTIDLVEKNGLKWSSTLIRQRIAAK